MLKKKNVLLPFYIYSDLLGEKVFFQLGGVAPLKEVGLEVVVSMQLD